MPKVHHEFRDPIHGFVRCSSEERKVIDSRPVQRLRHIHQLALTFLVYPGATHRRFEHSLGVMELADRVFSVVTRQENISDDVRELVPELGDEDQVRYWRRALRMAALCHDMGHLPFSHAAEDELLPEGWDHERITEELINSDEMSSIWLDMTPPLRKEDIVKLALGPKKKKEPFANWEALLSDIITGDSFGVDRFDYFLRDSHLAGVAYGRFDHFRLVDTLRILPAAPTAPREGTKAPDESQEPAIGVEHGGVQAAESLAWARYLMFSQVYFHSIRRIYDIHLKDFLAAVLPGGTFGTDCEGHLQMTDNEVFVVMSQAASDPAENGHEAARRLVQRDHFRILYSPLAHHRAINPAANSAIYEAAVEKFGNEQVRRDSATKGATGVEFPVLGLQREIASSTSTSPVLSQIPVPQAEHVYVAREIWDPARKWLEKNQDSVVTERVETEE
jgi:HD superfamily phosphohydrolase